MNSFHRIKLGSLVTVASFALGVSASAQQKQQALPQRASYDVARESVVTGTVVSFTAKSTIAPFGAHVSVQTASGIVDAHLGNPSLLQNSGLALNPGDSIKITGESVAYGQGAQFVARIIQKGNQSLTLRSTRGFPASPRASSANQQGGAL